MTLPEKISFYFSLPWQQKIWIPGLAVLSLLAAMMVHLVPARTMFRTVGRHQDNLVFSTLATREQIRTAFLLGLRMENVGNTVPWRSQCLNQCICLMWMFRFYRIPAVMHMGAKFDSKESLSAHAWIKVGPAFVSGDDGSKSFHVASTFTNCLDL